MKNNEEKNNKNENRLCGILYLISALLFAGSGISDLVTEGLSKVSGITSIALAITMGSMSVIYFKKMKDDK